MAFPALHSFALQLWPTQSSCSGAVMYPGTYLQLLPHVHRVGAPHRLPTCHRNASRADNNALQQQPCRAHALACLLHSADLRSHLCDAAGHWMLHTFLVCIITQIPTYLTDSCSVSQCCTTFCNHQQMISSAACIQVVCKRVCTHLMWASMPDCGVIHTAVLDPDVAHADQACNVHLKRLVQLSCHMCISDGRNDGSHWAVELVQARLQPTRSHLQEQMLLQMYQAVS